MPYTQLTFRFSQDNSLCKYLFPQPYFKGNYLETNFLETTYPDQLLVNVFL